MNRFLTILMLALMEMHDLHGQGFVNLDFESANLSGYSAGAVPAAYAIPSWTVYIGGTPLANINYNIGLLGGIEVSIIGTNAIQGIYDIYI